LSEGLANCTTLESPYRTIRSKKKALLKTLSPSFVNIECPFTAHLCNELLFFNSVVLYIYLTSNGGTQEMMYSFSKDEKKTSCLSRTTCFFNLKLNTEVKYCIHIVKSLLDCYLLIDTYLIKFTNSFTHLAHYVSNNPLF